MENNFENVLAEFTRVYKRKGTIEHKIFGSETTVKYIKSFLPQEVNYKEFFHVLYLNSQNQIIGYEKIGEGGITGVVADVRLIFSGALMCGAVSIIVTHNHPSGNLKASEPDKAITRKIKEGGKFLDITLLDHIITTETSYYSFLDNGEI